MTPGWDQTMAINALDLLLRVVDQAFDRQSWHGPNLRGSIRGIGPELAVWRPAHDRHSIAEQVVHAAYWKYVVRRRLLGEKRGSFPLKGSNWFARAAPLSAAAWQADIALLEDTHGSLRAAIAALDPGTLDRKAPGGTVTTLHLITGIAAHDVYHSGQIQLLKRLASDAAG
jgi:uncharacterized damage-inducible protein DinB